MKKKNSEFTLIKKFRRNANLLIILSDGRLSSQYHFEINIHNKDDLEKIDISIKSKYQITAFKELSDSRIMSILCKDGGVHIYKIFGKAYALKYKIDFDDPLNVIMEELKPNCLISCNNNHNGVLKIWHLRNNNFISEGSFHMNNHGPRNINLIKISDDKIVTSKGKENGIIQLWKIENNNFNNYSTLTNIDDPRGLFMYDKNTLIISNTTGFITIVNVNSIQIMIKFKYDKYNSSLPCSIGHLITLSNGNIIFSYSARRQNGGIKNYLVEYEFNKTITKKREKLRCHVNYIEGIAEFNRYIVTSGGGEIKIWK